MPDFSALGFHKSYRCPQPWEDPKGTLRLGWLTEARKEGTNYLKAQAVWPFLDQALAIISGMAEEMVPKNLSDVYVNRLRRQARELVATIANLRPLWGYRTDNEMFLAQSGNLTRLNLAWWQGTYADQKVKAALQWALVSTGYVMPVWRRNFWGPGIGDIDLIPLGPRDVLPVQIERDHDLQRAYAVIIVEETPIASMVRQFPHYADRIKATRNSPSWFGAFSSRLRRVVRGRRHLLDILHESGEDSLPSGPTCDKFTVYILDGTINRADRPHEMGKPGTSWHYRVPNLGSEIPTNGMEKQTKEATEDDCLLYPLRRKMICTEDVVLYDGPAENWHGQVPLAKFALDQWPDQFLGYSILHDGWSIQKAINNNLRAYQDYVNKVLKPDVKFDPNGAAAKDIIKYDPRVPGQRVPVDKRIGEEFEFLSLPPMPPGISPLEFHALLVKEMDHMLSIPDMKELARAAQIPSDNTLDKLQEIAGPVVEDMSRSMEQPLTVLGEQVKSMFYQYYPDQRKMAILGEDGRPQYFNFKRSMLVPDGFMDKEKRSDKRFLIPDNMEKARVARSECALQIVPGSLHRITQTKDKMFMLALWRDGNFPIDPQSLAERFDISQFGELPGSLPTMLQRWAVWMKVKVTTQVAMMKMQMVGQAEGQIEAQKALMMAQAEPLLQALQELIGQGGGSETGGSGPSSGSESSGNGNGASATGRPPGRPPSGEEPPHLVTKKDEAGSPRPVISESR
jgi:hypothetical protein